MTGPPKQVLAVLDFLTDLHRIICLHYEHEAYLQARKRFPKVGKILRTGQGEEKVTGWDLFRDTVSLRTADGTERTISLETLKSETSRSRESKS